MQWRKVLLGFSFYCLMVLSVLVIWLFASTVDLNTASNIRKSQAHGILKVADIQLLVAVIYALAGLFVVILLKRKSVNLSNALFGVLYALHFAFFLLPSFAYFLVAIV